ncbi:hypothetical protein [Hymenobacter properus]|uniref:Uncharacterized protein n=1 Tax=Hymenobacter properus TaxID=2791026 RepID=A0A931BKV8_9BACT|nr:hypothetical protein [Hymenobacter properus]MBF9144083.1 hypothetical protein [Hymenobacter properus]MBR7722899.1 hypothetical protein [Microvirga sp. SRT04]
MHDELLIEINDAIRAYCAQARSLTLTATDFYDWLASLPSGQRARVREGGLRGCRAEPEFLRFCLEWRGLDLWSFMAANLSLPAFDLWTATGQTAHYRPLPRRAAVNIIS